MRNEVLLVLVNVTNGNQELNKIMAFEGVCVCVCVCVLCVYIYIYTHTHTYIYIQSIHIFIQHMEPNKFLAFQASFDSHICKYTDTYIHTYIHACIHAYIYMYI